MTTTTHTRICTYGDDEAKSVDRIVSDHATAIRALREIVEIDESFNGSHKYAAIARAALAKVNS